MYPRMNGDKFFSIKKVYLAYGIIYSNKRGTLFADMGQERINYTRNPLPTSHKPDAFLPFHHFRDIRHRL